MALVCSLAIHLALLFGLILPLARNQVDATGGWIDATSLQLRFVEMRLQAHSRPQASTPTVPAVARRQPVILTPPVVHATKAVKATPLSVAPDLFAAPAIGGDLPRSDSWDIEPLDKRSTGDGDYIQRLPKVDASVMTRSAGGITYHATRFDSSWSPDRQNAVKQAIDRGTFHAKITLPLDVQLDCAGSPSSPETLRTTVAVLALASTNCHGSSPPAPMAAKALLDIQTLAPAKPLAGQAEPSTSTFSPGGSINEAACANARVAGVPLPVDCRTRATPDTNSGESGSLPRAMPLAKSPALPAH